MFSAVCRKRTSAIAIAIAAAGFLGAAVPASATTWIHDPGSPGDWFDAANWSNGVPTHSVVAEINNGGTVAIAGTAASADEIFLAGNHGSGAITIAGNGSLATDYREYVGISGSGSVKQDGSNALGDDLLVGYLASGTGTYELNAGTLTLATGAGATAVGFGGVGFFSQRGGQHTTATLGVGYQATGSGTYELSGGELRVDGLFGSDEYIGWQGAGTLIQSGGSNIITNSDPSRARLYIAQYPGSTGFYELQDGTLSAGFMIDIGAGGNGTLVQSGGSLAARFLEVHPGGTYHIKGGGVGLTESLDVVGGRMVVSAGGDKTLRLSSTSLAVTKGGQIDLADNAMIYDYSGSSPLSNVQSLITSGYANGAWTGTGINSSVAASAANRALGFAEASDLGVSTFAGQPVDSTAVLIRYTAYGDANLDQVVDTLDFNALAANFGAAGARWSSGDFNFDGVIDTTDFNRLAANFGQRVEAVPEPGAVSIGVFVSLVLLRRQR